MPRLAILDPALVIKLIQSQPAVYKLDGQDKLRISKNLPDTSSRIKVLTDLFDFIAVKDTSKKLKVES